MKVWHEIVKALLAVLISGVIVSCVGHDDNQRLVDIDSLILQAPDSACKLLAAYPTDSLATDNDRAYHALLTTIADYKAYRPATTDSVINIAVGHYDHDGANHDHRMRSLLYKGCVMEELGDYKEAMRCYKYAQYACPDDDNFHKGYIHYRIAGLYKENYKIQSAIKHFKLALNEFCDSKDYLNSCYNNIGKLYVSIDTDSALKYNNHCIEIALNSGDTTMLFEKYEDLANVYYTKQEYAKAKYLANKTISYSSNRAPGIAAYFVAVESHLKLSEVDSAQLLINKIPPPATESDSLMLCSLLVDICDATNDLKKSQRYTQQIDNINKSIDLKLNDNSIVSIENEIDIECKNKQSQSTMHLLLKWALGSFLVVAFFSVWYTRRQRKMFRNAQIQIQALNERITSSLLEINKAKEEQDILALKNTEYKAYMEGEVNKAIESLDQSIRCYSNILGDLLKEHKVTSATKSKKIKSLLTNEFFDQIHQVVNLRYKNLVFKLKNSGINLTEEEINIICLDLCKFPNPILWTYSSCDRYKSLLNKKKIIAQKVHQANSIQEIPGLL